MSEAWPNNEEPWNPPYDQGVLVMICCQDCSSLRYHHSNYIDYLSTPSKEISARFLFDSLALEKTRTYRKSARTYRMMSEISACHQSNVREFEELAARTWYGTYVDYSAQHLVSHHNLGDLVLDIFPGRKMSKWWIQIKRPWKYFSLIAWSLVILIQVILRPIIKSDWESLLLVSCHKHFSTYILHQMSYPNYVFSIFAFIGFLLAIIPLPWHLEGTLLPLITVVFRLTFSIAWNVGTCLFMVWIAAGCLIQFVNSIIWNGNTINHAPVWCDIGRCPRLSVIG